MIPYGRQNISESDIESVVSVLRSDFLTQGPAVSAFETKLSEMVEARHAVAVNSATSALHISCLALGLEVGDWLWTSPISFVASANCGAYCGANIDFVDIDEISYNMCPEALESKLVQAEREGRLPKVVVVVHLSGHAYGLHKIWALSQRYGFKVIEDASHAVGAKFEGRPVGSCVYSDITVFSFHPVKIITTGEGGVAVTQNDQIAERLLRLRTHGITRDQGFMSGETHGPWYYEQLELGYNYRMTDIQAALGISQLDRLEEFVRERNSLARLYDDKLRALPLITPVVPPSAYSARHLYVIRLKLNDISCSRKEVFESLRSLGIGVNVHYIPITRQPYYVARGAKASDFPQSEKYYEEAISIPLYYGLSEYDLHAVVAALEDALS